MSRLIDATTSIPPVSPSPTDLRNAIVAASAEYEDSASSALNVAKAIVYKAIVTAAQKGAKDTHVATSLIKLPVYRLYNDLNDWLKEAGVEGKYVNDVRDGDYLRLSWE